MQSVHALPPGRVNQGFQGLTRVSCRPGGGSKEKVLRSLAKRVKRLEKDPCFQPPPPPTAKDLLFDQKARELLNMVDEKFGLIVVEELNKIGSLDYVSPITVAMIEVVEDHVNEGRPLAFPNVVAEAFMSPYMGEKAACLECRYRLPPRAFKVCPLCGGKVR